MVKAVTLFLVFILALGILGKLHWIGLPNPRGRKILSSAKKCPKCGKPKFKGIECSCSKNKKT